MTKEAGLPTAWLLETGTPFLKALVPTDMKERRRLLVQLNVIIDELEPDSPGLVPADAYKEIASKDMRKRQSISASSKMVRLISELGPETPMLIPIDVYRGIMIGMAQGIRSISLRNIGMNTLSFQLRLLREIADGQYEQVDRIYGGDLVGTIEAVLMAIDAPRVAKEAIAVRMRAAAVLILREHFKCDPLAKEEADSPVAREEVPNPGS